MRFRLLVVLLALLSAIPALSGCGGDGDGDGAGGVFSAAAVAKSADATVAKGGTKIAIQSEATAPGIGKLTLVGEGEVDAQTQKGHLKLRVSDAPGLPASVDKDTLSQEIVSDRLVLYLRSPAFAATLKGGKKWVKLDLVEAGNKAGVDFSLLAQAGQDPTQSLRFLKAVSGDVQKLGEEEVRGVATTHYKANVDLRKFPETVPPADRKAARATIEYLIKGLGGVSTSPVEFWIGKDNLVRRYVQSLTIKIPGGTSAIKQQIEFYDYGTKVDVTIPPADEVQDGTDLAAAGISGKTP